MSKFRNIGPCGVAMISFLGLDTRHLPIGPCGIDARVLLLRSRRRLVTDAFRNGFSGNGSSTTQVLGKCNRARA